MLQTLNGQWHLIYTSFAVWKGGKNTDVNFNYTLTERDGKLCLLDEVKYLKAGKNKSIKGYDFFDAQNQYKFIWQGKGWMFWIKCPWKIEWINEAKTCIVLSFEKTLLTSGGVDIITRAKSPLKEVLAEALAVISNDEFLRKSGQNFIRVLQQ